MADSFLRTRLFVAVYEERSFTAAAAREYATQSGVSQHIQKLEEQLGVRLFTRDTNRVMPTPAGDAYYAACLDVLKSLEHARNVVSAYGGGLEGEISVGITPTVARTVLAPALAQFRAEQPNVIVRVVEAYSDMVAEKVLAGDFNFAVVPAFHNARGIRSTPFARTPEFLVSATSAGRRHLQPVRLAQAGPLKLVVPTTAQRRRAHLEDFLSLVGARVDARLEIDTMLGTLDFVSRTDWCAILPGVMTMRETDAAEFTMNPIVDPPLVLDLFRIENTRQESSAAAQAFALVLREQAERIGERIERLMAAAPDQES